MTTPITKSMPTVCIEAISFTPGREPVIIQYSGLNTTVGPLATSQLHHATQAALQTRVKSPGAVWGDAEAIADLADHLTDCGIAAEVVVNADPSREAEAPS